jgi:hypothetical protein
MTTTCDDEEPAQVNVRMGVCAGLPDEYTFYANYTFYCPCLPE